MYNPASRLAALSLLVLTTGCSQKYVFQADADPSTGNATIIFPDGTVTNSYADYQNAVQSIYASVPNATVEVDIGDQMSDELATEYSYASSTTDDGKQTAWYHALAGGHFGLSGGWSDSYVVGIQRNGWHYNIRLNYNRPYKQIFDLHGMVFENDMSYADESNNGAWCWQVYESVSYTFIPEEPMCTFNDQASAEEAMGIQLYAEAGLTVYYAFMAAAETTYYAAIYFLENTVAPMIDGAFVELEGVAEAVPW